VSPAPPPPNAGLPAGWRRLLYPESWSGNVYAVILLAIVTWLTFSNTLDVPRIGDERAPGHWAAGRWPVTDVTLALNALVGGRGVPAFHATNLALHLGAGLLLFALLQRTLAGRPGAGGRLRPLFPALAGAALWLLHPLQSAAVVPPGQRGPLLAAFFLLLTLYAVVRLAAAENKRGWFVVAVSASTAGMASAPGMIVAPVLALLYDRAFLAGSFSAVWSARGRLHLALAATWFVALAGSLRTAPTLASAGRFGGAGEGWGLAGSAWAAWIQLRLALWPHPLVFDRGMLAAPDYAWVFALAAGAAAAVLIAPLRRWSAPGFLGAWLFVTLAAAMIFARPAEGIVSEARMHLPLAALAAGLAGAAWRWGGRSGVAAVALLAVAGGFATWERNTVFGSALTLWQDTVVKAPANPRAHHQLGNALAAAGRLDDAVLSYETALPLAPGDAALHVSLAGVLLQLGRPGEAVAEFQAAVRADPGSASAQVGLAAALVRLGRRDEANAHYEAATRLGVNAAEGRRLFGRALAEVGEIDEALVYLEEAVALDPQDAGARVILGMVLSAAGRSAEGMRHLIEAVQMEPDDAGAHYALGDALLEEHRPAEALVHYETVIRLQPARAAMLHTSMGHALTRLGRAEEAIAQYEDALRLNPDDDEARDALAKIQAAARRREGRR